MDLPSNKALPASDVAQSDRDQRDRLATLAAYQQARLRRMARRRPQRVLAVLGHWLSGVDKPSQSQAGGRSHTGH